MAEESKQDEHAQSKGNTDKAKSDFWGMIAQFETTLDEYMVRKAPFQIPMGGKEFLVTIAPYLILVFAVLSIPIIIAALGLTTILSPFMMMGGYYHFGVFGVISGVIALIALVMELYAVKGLFQRTHASWRILYYVSLITFVGNLFSYNVIGGIIGSIIGWYILFQVKELYK